MKIFPRPMQGRCTASGFTLLEILVATAVTAIIGTLLLSATQGVLSNYTRTQGSITRQGDLSFVLDQIALDLDGLVIPNAARAEGLGITRETVGGLNDRPWLTLLSTTVDKDNSTPVAVNGATRAVSYRLAHQPIMTGETEKRFALYRSVASSAHTFNNAIGKTNLQGGYWTNIPADPAPTPRATTELGNLLSENITGFNIIFQYRDTVGTLQWTAPTDTISIRRDGAFINGSATPVPGGFVRAQISVEALTPEGVRRVEAGVPLETAIEQFGASALREPSLF